MSRFYQTDKPIFVDDKMFQAPLDLMVGVIEKKDAQAKEQEGKVDEFTEILNQLESLEIDDPVVQGRIDEYKAQMEGVINNVYGDMDSYLKVMPTIRRITTELDRDMNVGTFGLAGKNLTKRSSYEKSLKERKDLSEDQKKLVLDNADYKYQKVGGIYDEEGAYNPYPDEFILPAGFDITTESKKVTKNPKILQTAWSGIKDDEYGGFRSGTKKSEMVTREDAIEAAEAYWDAGTGEEFHTAIAELEAIKAVRNGTIKEEEVEEFITDYVKEKKDAFTTLTANNLEKNKVISTSSYSRGSEGERAETDFFNSQTDITKDWDGRNQGQKKHDTMVENKLKAIYNYPSDTKVTSEELARRTKKDIDAAGGVDQYLSGIYYTLSNSNSPNYNPDLIAATGRDMAGFMSEMKEQLRQYSINAYNRYNASNYTEELPDDASLADKKQRMIKEKEDFEEFVTQASSNQEVYYEYEDASGVTHTGKATLEDLFAHGVEYDVDETKVTETDVYESEGSTATGKKVVKKEKTEKDITPIKTYGKIPPYQQWKTGTYRPKGQDYNLGITVGNEEIYENGGYNKESKIYTTSYTIDKDGNPLPANTNIRIYRDK